MSKKGLLFSFECSVFERWRPLTLGRKTSPIGWWSLRFARFSIAYAFLALQPVVQGSELLFRDDFMDRTLNRAFWGIGDWKLGRSQLGLVPEIKQGVARLSFNTQGFMGTEIYSQRFFTREGGLEIKVRARLGKSPPGLVSGIFTYATDRSGASDEIDIEFLSKGLTNKRKALPVMLSTWHQWNEASSELSDVSHHWTTRLSLDGVDPSVWHEYVIRWLPDRTEWFVDQKLVASSMLAQPELPTRIRFNLWAPSASWELAYSTLLMPSFHPNSNQKYFLELDWVEVNRL